MPKCTKKINSTNYLTTYKIKIIWWTQANRGKNPTGSKNEEKSNLSTFSTPINILHLHENLITWYKNWNYGTCASIIEPHSQLRLGDILRKDFVIWGLGSYTYHMNQRRMVVLLSSTPKRSLILPLLEETDDWSTTSLPSSMLVLLSLAICCKVSTAFSGCPEDTRYLALSGNN